jgi:hypothetical protein
MTFNIEFMAASAADAQRIVADEKRQVPDSVRAFVDAALSTMGDGPVYVKAVGHLCAGAGWHPTSTATLEVRPLAFRAPPPVDAA